jgi:hypothetical protein
MQATDGKMRMTERTGKKVVTALNAKTNLQLKKKQKLKSAI